MCTTPWPCNQALGKRQAGAAAAVASASTRYTTQRRSESSPWASDCSDVVRGEANEAEVSLDLCRVCTAPWRPHVQACHDHPMRFCNTVMLSKMQHRRLGTQRAGRVWVQGFEPLTESKDPAPPNECTNRPPVPQPTCPYLDRREVKHEVAQRSDGCQADTGISIAPQPDQGRRDLGLHQGRAQDLAAARERAYELAGCQPHLQGP